MEISRIKEPQTLLNEAQAIAESIVKLEKMGIHGSVIDRLHNQKENCIDEARQLQTIFDSIPDREIREMIRLYQSGKSWKEIHYHIFKYHCVDHGDMCRKRVERYLSKL